MKITKKSVKKTKIKSPNFVIEKTIEEPENFESINVKYDRNKLCKQFEDLLEQHQSFITDILLSREAFRTAMYNNIVIFNKEFSNEISSIDEVTDNAIFDIFETILYTSLLNKLQKSYNLDSISTIDLFKLIFKTEQKDPASTLITNLNKDIKNLLSKNEKYGPYGNTGVSNDKKAT